MPTNKVKNNTLDIILAFQIAVACAGEGTCDPKRLDWWRNASAALRNDLLDGDVPKISISPFCALIY